MNDIDYVSQELVRILGWQIDVTWPHNDDDDCVWIAEYHDVEHNTGEGLGEYSVTKLRAKLQSQQWLSYPDGEDPDCQYKTVPVRNREQICDPHPRYPRVVADESFEPPWELLEGCEWQGSR